MSNAYEQLRDSATGEAGEAWKGADREEGNLRALYRELKEDPRFTEEHKAEKAWARYDAAHEKIAAGKAKARELLERQARSAERLSLPFPDGEGPVTTDASKLIASQNEAARVVRRLDRLDGTKGPFKPDRLELLRAEYGSGLEAGGVQGGAVCRGVLSAADELGVDRHAVVEGFRKERHHESLERAEHSERLARTVGGSAPESPFARPGEARRVPGQYGHGSGALLVPREGTPISGPRRRPSWK